MFSKCALAFCILTIICLSRRSQTLATHTCLWSNCYDSTYVQKNECESVAAFGRTNRRDFVPKCLYDPVKKWLKNQIMYLCCPPGVEPTPQQKQVIRDNKGDKIKQNSAGKGKQLPKKVMLKSNNAERGHDRNNGST